MEVTNREFDCTNANIYISRLVTSVKKPKCCITTDLNVKFQLRMSNPPLPSSSRMVTTTSVMLPAATRPSRVPLVITRCATKSSSISRIESSKMTMSATTRGFPGVKVTFCVVVTKSTSPALERSTRQVGRGQQNSQPFHLKLARNSCSQMVTLPHAFPQPSGQQVHGLTHAAYHGFQSTTN